MKLLMLAYSTWRTKSGRWALGIKPKAYLNPQTPRFLKKKTIEFGIMEHFSG